MFLLIVLAIIGSIFLVCMALVPSLQEQVLSWKKEKEKAVEVQMEQQFYYDKSPQQIIRLYFILPPVMGIVGLVFFRSVLFLIAGVLLGLFIPNLILKMRDTKRKMKFNSQLLDAIMILSSSLKGGLSLLQALEVVAEEMQPPMNQEIGLVVRENKMGVTLDDSLRHLKVRMGLKELNLVVHSVLVARETGGDLTKVLSRLTTTIRDNQKLQDNIKTLTMQGRMQGVIMSALPFVFVWWVVSFNREHFNIMLQNELGRTLLFVAGALQIIGMILIKKFSAIRF